MSNTTDVQSWIGVEAMDRYGEKVGKIDQVYVDRDTGEAEWLAVKTGLFGTRVSFVPIEGAAIDDDRAELAYAKDQIKDAPTAENDGELSEAEERALYAHFGRAWDDDAGRDASGPTTDDAMTRSEEELRVGTAQRESGRVRLRKVVVTEQQTVSVPVQREGVRIEREPVTDANRDVDRDADR